jgi:hypothetical protein
MAQTPREYVLYKLQTMSKGNVRMWITNMLRESYLQSDKDFYTEALKELDDIKKLESYDNFIGNQTRL